MESMGGLLTAEGLSASYFSFHNYLLRRVFLQETPWSWQSSVKAGEETRCDGELLYHISLSLYYRVITDL
jgi:hypothetical protein